MRRQLNVPLLLTIGGLLLLGALLAGCRPDTTAPELQATPTEGVQPEAAQVDMVADAGQTSGVTAVEFTDQACLDCHTDQEQLKLLAVDKPQESLSSGPG